MADRRAPVAVADKVRITRDCQSAEALEALEVVDAGLEGSSGPSEDSSIRSSRIGLVLILPGCMPDLPGAPVLETPLIVLYGLARPRGGSR